MANSKNIKKPRATALAHLATPDHKKSQDAIPKLSIDLAEAKHLNPYVEHVAKRLRALRKRMQKIEKMEEKVKSLAPHEINEEQRAVLAKKPELSITMKELTEIVDNLVQISKNPPVEEKVEEAQEEKQEETQHEQQSSEEVIAEEISVVTEAEAQVHSEIHDETQPESESVEQEDISNEKHFENPELFQALKFFSSLLSTYFNKSLPISPDDYQSLELFRSVVLSGDFERPDGRQTVIEHLQKLSLQSEVNVTEEYPVTYQQVHKVVSSIAELNSFPPQENGDQEHQYQFEAEQQAQPVEKEIQVFNTVSRPPGGFNFMTTSEILENHQAVEEPELPIHQEIQEIQEIQDQAHTAFPEPQQYNTDVNYGNDQWDQYQDQISYKQDSYQQFPSADNNSEVPLVSQAGFENPLSVLMTQPSSDSYPPQHTQHTQSNDLPSQNDQDNVAFNDNQRNWQRRTNRDYRRNNNANYGGKPEYRHNYQYENNYDSNGNIGANNQYRTNPDKYRNRANWNQNHSSPNTGDHTKTNSGHYGYNGNQNTFRNSRNNNSRSYGGNYRGPRDGYDGMISQNHNSGYQH